MGFRWFLEFTECLLDRRFPLFIHSVVDTFYFYFYFYCYSAYAWDINESKCRQIKKKTALFALFAFFLAAPVYQYNNTQIAFLRIPLLRPSVIVRLGVYYSPCRSFYLRRLDMIPYCLLLASLLPCFLCFLPALPPLPPPTARLALFLFAAASATAASTYTL